MDDAQELDRVVTPRGELVLRRVGEHLEVVSNGVFLMDTSAGSSERALVHEALAAHPAPASVLIGGLGVGFSLCAAVAHDRLERIVVVEIEQRVVDWHATHLAHVTADALADARVTVTVDDVHGHLDRHPVAYDVVCLDVDNGPDWTVTDDNTRLYAPGGIDHAGRALTPGGVLAVWSAARSTRFEALLRERLSDVRTIEVAVDVPRAEPDVIYLGRRPGPDPAR
jgi:spermidine synthase